MVDKMKKLILTLFLLLPSLAVAQNDIAEGQQALFATIAITAASGDQTILSAVSGKKIRVLGYALVTDTASALTWESGGSTAISGAMTFAANGGISAVPSKWGWVETLSGESLVLNVGTAATVGGHVTYVLVD